MNWKSYRQQSRDIQWGTNGDRLSVEQINCGSLLQIADATELMAQRYSALIDERDRYDRWYRDERRRREAAERRVSALRGVITRMKRKAAEDGRKA